MKLEAKRSRFALLGLAVIVVAVVLGTAMWSKFGRGLGQIGREKSPLESLGNFGSVPDFSLTERSGDPLRLADLRGKIWVVNFIYTSCKDTCPLQSAAMAKLQRELSGESRVRLVSISVDPARDTPQVLSAYAGRYGAQSDRWFFLTGDREAIYGLVQGGFHLSAAPAPEGPDGKSRDFLHSPRFVLVDRVAQIRGYYDSRDPEAMDRLRRDLAFLLYERRPSYG